MNDGEKVKIPADFFIRFLSQVTDVAIFIVLAPLMLVFLDLPITNKISWVVLFVFHFMYFGLLPFRFGKTVGKNILKLKIVGLSEESLTFRQSMIRYFSCYLSLLMFGAGFFIPLFNKGKRSFHDYTAKTQVVYYSTPHRMVVALLLIGMVLFYWIFALLSINSIPRLNYIGKWQYLGHHNQNNLLWLKDAISEYFKRKGYFPKRLTDIKDIKYDAILPTDLRVFKHEKMAVVENYPFLTAEKEVNPKLLRDTGHWLYDSSTGILIID